MAIIGVQCVRGDVPMEEHLRCMREEAGPPCGIDPTLLEMMTRPNKKRIDDGVVYSPSSIQACHRQYSLTRNNDWYVNVKKSYSMIRGTVFHQGIAREPAPTGTLGVVAELRLHSLVSTKYGPQRFSGQVDRIVLDRIEGNVLHVKIADYKTKTTVGPSLVEAEDRHVQQINYYAWLVKNELLSWLETATPAQREEHLILHAGPLDLSLVSDIAIDELTMVYLTMSTIRTFTSRGFLYTDGRIKGSKGEDGRFHQDVPRAYEELELLPMSFFDYEDIQADIIKGIEKQIEGDTQLAEPLYGEDARMRCGGCPVKQQCYDIGRAQGFPMKDQEIYIV